MGKSFLFFVNLLRELPYSFQDILEAWDKSPLEPFEMVRDVVEQFLGKIFDIRVHGSYFNPENITVVIEYMVEHEHGITGVKIIHAESPVRALIEYYRAERKRVFGPF